MMELIQDLPYLFFLGFAVVMYLKSDDTPEGGHRMPVPALG
jgi:hypothetical protein